MAFPIYDPCTKAAKSFGYDFSISMDTYDGVRYSFCLCGAQSPGVVYPGMHPLFWRSAWTNWSPSATFISKEGEIAFAYQTTMEKIGSII